MSRVGVWIALLATSWVPPARADDPAPAEAKRYFERGREASSQGHYTDALANFRQSYQLAPRPNVLYNIARCEELLDDLEAAYAHYEQFLAQVPPDHPARASAEAARVQLAGKLVVALPVSTSPPGAAVFVDGNAEAAGQTPTTLKLRAGHHTLRLVAAGALPKQLEIESHVGSPLAVAVALERYGRIEIIALPHDAQIERADGASAPVRGRFAEALSPGTYRFRIRRDGYAEASLEIRLAEGETCQKQVDLAQGGGGSGALVVRANVSGAIVFVDALPVGSTRGPSGPLTVDISSGPHEIDVEEDGHLPWRGRVMVRARGVTEIDARLAAKRSRRGRIGLWGLGAGGTAALIAGGIFGVVAIDDYAEVARTRSRDANDRAESHALWSTVLVGVGAAALVGATVWHVASDRPSGADVRDVPPDDRLSGARP